MSLLLSIAQINPIVGDFKHNTQLIVDAIQQAKGDKADAVLFPELVLTGYPPEDLLFRPAFLKKVESTLAEIAKAATGITVILGAPVQINNKLFNMACVLHDGEIIHQYAKQHLPNYRVFDEKRYFRRGKENGIIEIAGHKIGLLICEDIWKFGVLLHALPAAFPPLLPRMADLSMLLAVQVALSCTCSP